MIKGLVWSVLFFIYGLFLGLLFKWFKKLVIVKLRNILGIFGSLLGWSVFAIFMIFLFFLWVAIFASFMDYFFDYYIG